MESPLFSTPAPAADALTLDVSEIPEARLEVMPRANGIAKFQPLLARLPDIEAQVDSLVIRTSDTPEEMAQKSAGARRLRLDGFRATRLEAKKLHTELKAGILEIGKQLDGAERELRQRCEKWEAELDEIETHAELMEHYRRAELRQARAKEISPFFTGPLALDLADLSPEDYATQLNDARELHELRQARAKAAEEARLKAEREAEEARQAEAKRQAEERERIKQEKAALAEERKAAEAERARVAAEREAERRAATERQKEADAKAAAERARLAEEARQIAIERERMAEQARAAKAKADAEAAAAARAAEEQAAASARAAAAPDAEKVRALMQRLVDMPLPKLDNIRVFQACDRAVKLATDQLARIAAKLEGGAQ